MSNIITTNDNTIIPTNDTPATAKSADEYLRFALKSSELIENLAKDLDWYKEQLSVNGTTQRQLAEYYGDSGQASAHLEKIRHVSTISNKLRDFNDQIARIYTHAADAAEIRGIENPAILIAKARFYFADILSTSGLSSKDLVKNGQIQGDIDAIDQRLLPVIGRDSTFKATVDAYHAEAPKRLANARKGMMPEGLGTVTQTHINPDHIPDHTPGQKRRGMNLTVENVKMVPETETKRRPAEFGEDGKRITGEPLYQRIKSEKAAKLTLQSIEAEKTRNGEGVAWERRIDAEAAAKATDEPHR